MKLDKNAILARIRTLQKELDGLVDAILEIEDTPAQAVQPAKSYGEWFTAKELARHYRVSAGTIYDWVAKGIIPSGTAFGQRQTRWRLSEVEANFRKRQEESRVASRRGRPSKIRRKEEFSYA